MHACDGKHNRKKNERKRQHPDSRNLSCFKREKRQRPANETTKQIKTPPEKTLYDLPLEILDIILQRSYLHWILNSPMKLTDEEVIRSLISVDVCFNRRIIRRRFKKAIWRYLKVFYGKARKRFAIIRNIRNYLLENMKPNDELISALLSLKCITQKQSLLIQRQHCDRHKNDELLNVMRPFEEKRFSNFMKCLRQTNQRIVARIMENGGGLIKLNVETRDKIKSASMETAILHQNIEDLQSRTRPWSQGTDKFISELREKDIEILNSRMERQTVVVWIWCHSQASLEYIERLYESQLKDVLFEEIQPSTFKIINIDGNEFKKTIVVSAISIKFTQRIAIPRNKRDPFIARGVTKLRNEIYFLYKSPSDDTNTICVLEDRNSFRRRKKIEIKEMKYPFDIGSSEEDDCLYVADLKGKCVWKITRETDDEYRIIKWLTTDYDPYTLSVSSDGQLLLVDRSSSSLWIYGSDAAFIRYIQLANDIRNVLHAVKTSIGNFIICHSWMENELIAKNQAGDWSTAREEKLGEKENQRDEEEENDVRENNKAKEKEGKENEEGAEMEENKEGYDTHDEENERVEVTENDNEKEMDEEEEEEEEEEGKEQQEKESGVIAGLKSNKRHRERVMFAISELTKDGQIVVRRFSSSNETQRLGYLSLDADDQVFVVDYGNDRVIVLDSDLKWNRTLLPGEDGDKMMRGMYLRTRTPMYSGVHRLCYDDESKQIIVAGYIRGIFGLHVYSVIRI